MRRYGKFGDAAPKALGDIVNKQEGAKNNLQWSVD